MNWMNIINKKYSEDTTFGNFDSIEGLINAMLKNDVMNAKSLRSMLQENMVLEDNGKNQYQKVSFEMQDGLQ